MRKAPLVFASMTGDLDNVKLLLTHGADQRAGTALPDAVTFGYPDIVEMLIRSGASATITESSGINLLHWAAIINRPAVIPVLVEAGVPLNSTDENGYTPLMYAATIDFGDAEAVKQLLKAGANRNVRNNEGRTPLEQARRYRHTLLADTLR